MSNFIAELQGSTPGMNNMMDNQSVPPDTQMAEEAPMIQQEIDEIDSGEVDPSISPQTMETQQV